LAIPASDIVEAQLKQEVGVVGNLHRFGPVIDGITIPRPPLEMLELGRGSCVPTLMGRIEICKSDKRSTTPQINVRSRSYDIPLVHPLINPQELADCFASRDLLQSVIIDDFRGRDGKRHLNADQQESHEDLASWQKDHPFHVDNSQEVKVIILMK
jgi:hypothetical protein